MATFSPHTGLGASLAIGGPAGLIYYYKLTRIGRTAGETIAAMVPRKSSPSSRQREYEEWKRDREKGTYHYPPHVAFLHGFVVFLATSCTAFAILNLTLQVNLINPISREQAWKIVWKQWVSGTLVLRASTVWFCGVVVSRQAYYYLKSGFPGSARAEEVKEFSEDFRNVSVVIDEANRRLRDFLQSAIFVFSLSAIWVVYADGIKSPVIALISWGFAFFCDDSQIISAYSREIKGRVLRWHKRRIDAANCILVVSISYLTIEQMGIASLAWFITILPLRFLRYVGLHESQRE